jgi:HAD superfamily hydrolase (TIGR01509 family)
MHWTVDLMVNLFDESRKMQKNDWKLESVIFDMDGTLIDTERMGAASWDHAGEEVGLFVSEEVKRRMVGRNMPDIRSMVQEDLPGEDVEPLLDRADFHYHRLVTEAPPPIKPGARELLEWLRARSIPMALATSSRAHQAEDKLGRTGLRGFFDFLIAGDQIERGKPDPQIFLRAAEGLGCLIGNCAVFEDSLPGIEAANRSGAFAVLVPEIHPADPDLAFFAHAVLSDLTQAPGLLRPYII